MLHAPTADDGCAGRFAEGVPQRAILDQTPERRGPLGGRVVLHYQAGAPVNPEIADDPGSGGYGDRQAGGERFDHHEAEWVHPCGKREYVRIAEQIAYLVGWNGAQKTNSLIVGHPQLQVGEGRSITSDGQAAWQVVER